MTITQLFFFSCSYYFCFFSLFRYRKAISPFKHTKKQQQELLLLRKRKERKGQNNIIQENEWETQIAEEADEEQEILQRTWLYKGKSRTDPVCL